VGAESFARRYESPLVGRKRELALLRQAYQRAIDEQACHLFTILGSAGIGKSRLTHEFLGRLGETATVLTGRCLPYGEGITYWPLVEILRQLGSEECVVQFLEGEREARSIVNTVFTLVGQAEAATSPEETPWAVRKLFEALAREHPLVVVLDDLQWAEPTFLDLVEHVADWSREAPILLLCSARPELLDARPGWGGGKLNATSILLEPLTQRDSDALIDNLLAGVMLDTAVRTRIDEAAEGNPLFVEQMLAMLSEEEPGGEVGVPPTIQALLAARLDRLDTQERIVIERASVVGKEFWLRAVTELSPEPTQAASALQRLVRKELIRPHRSVTFPNDETFRFRHILIRDAAYDGMAKELRAELHERFSEWLEGERSEFDEIVGYHLEQAYRYRSELGPLDERGRDLGRRAGERLGAAGERALARSDMSAAGNLLERALAVLPRDHARRNELRLGLGDALVETDFAAAGATLGELIEDAATQHDARIEWRARVELAWMQLQTQELAGQDAAKVASAAIDALTELDDESGLARAWQAAAQARNVAGDTAGIEAAMRQALVHARRAGDTRLETEASFWIGLSAFYGATPVPDALTVCQDLLESARTQLQHANATFWLGAVQALGGQLDEGRSSVARGRALYAELGLRTVHGGSAMPHAKLELLAGDAVAAEGLLREAADELERVGEKAYQSTVLVILAEALYQQGRYGEAEQAMGDSKAMSAPDDVMNLALLGSVGGKLLARRGEFSKAETTAQDAVKQIEAEGNPAVLGDALMALAEVLQLADRPQEAHDAAERALAVYEQKGIVPAMERTRAFIAELVPA
jgi:tetratricopeptide (TPR) repeat protein